ncbi:MAG: pitrilysin family protein [Caulobacter sp.]|nr:pitrilysin family protein [Caulobacter sp.]
MFRSAKALSVAFALAALITPASRAWAQELAGGPPPAAIEVPPISFQTRVLANGMKVYSSLDATTPNVTVQVWYGVGSKDDPQGRSGFAHLFEHLMFKATRDLPAEAFDRMTEDVGGFNNASTWDDFTNYYEVVPANHLQRLLWAEANRLGSLVVDEASFKSERDVVKEELRLRVLSDPYGRFFNLVIPDASYTTHPYHRPGIGSIEELDAATIDDVRAFHETYYRPDNAALIVVGNFDQARLDAWVDQYFAPMVTPARPLPRVTAVEPLRAAARTVTAYAPNVPLPAVAITWQGPTAADPDAAALTVLDAILSGGKSSRLYNSLVYDQQLAQAAFSDASLNAQPGLFYVGAIMAGGKTVEQGEAALMAEVRRLREAPPTAAELAEARTELIASAVRDRETIDGRAFSLGYSLMLEGDAAKANTGVAELQAVTAADVQRVAARYLADDRLVLIRYLDESQRPAGQTAAADRPARPVKSGKFRGQLFTLAPEGQRQAPPPLGAPVSPTLPTPSEKTLANGLRVIVARSSSLPLVTADLTVMSGAAADPAGRAGASSMMAELLTEGTTTRGAVEIAARTEALGAALSAGSGWESASVTLNVMPVNLKPAMALMADVALNPAFSQDELDRVREQSLDGFQVALKRPGSVAGFVVAPIIYGGTAYGHVASGTPGSLPALTREDLMAVHRTWWRPDNAVLVIAGDLTPEEGFALAEQAFGGWTRPAGPPPARPTADTVAPPRELIIDMPAAGQAAIVIARRGIARNDPRYYAGVVANTVLGGGYSARLNQEVRVRRGLAYGASSSLSPRRVVGGFAASTQTKNESAAEVITLIRGEMSGMATRAATPAELAARKSVLIGDFGRDVGTTEGLAGILGGLAVSGVRLDEMLLFTGKVEAVTAAEVQAFSADILNPAPASVIVVGDASKFAAAIRAVLPGARTISLPSLDLDSPTLEAPPK